jgi:hypothetical protein
MKNKKPAIKRNPNALSVPPLPKSELRYSNKNMHEIKKLKRPLFVINLAVPYTKLIVARERKNGKNNVIEYKDINLLRIKHRDLNPIGR